MKIPEQVYKNMIEFFDDMLIITDEAYRIIDVNAKTLKIFGKTLSEMQGLELPSLLTNEVRDQLFSNKLTADHPRSEFQRTTLDTGSSTLIPVSYRYTLCEIDGEAYYYFRFIDVSQQTKLEDKLKLTETQFQILFEQNIVGVAEIEKNGYFIRVNEKYANMLGYTSDELMLLNYKSLSHPDDLAWSVECGKQVMDGKVDEITYEKRYLTKSDQYLWVSVTIRTIRNAQDGRFHYFAIINDISEIKKTQSELSIANERLRVAQEFGNVASWEFYLDSAMVWSTANGFKMFGYDHPDGEMPVSKIYATVPDLDKMMSALSNFMEGNHPNQIEFIVNPIDGSPQRTLIAAAELIRDKNGVPIILKGVSHDITLIKKLQGELISTQIDYLVLAKLISHSSQAMSIGYPDGTLGIHNKAFTDLLGYDESEISSLNYLSDAFSSPESQETEKAALAELMRTNKPVRYEKEYIRKDGSRINVELFTDLEKDKQGNLKYFYTFITDITERKNLQAALLEEQKRSVALEDFIRRSSQPMAIGNPDSTLGIHNQAYLDLFGYDESDVPMLNKDPFAVTPPEWLEFERNKLQELIKTHVPVTYEKEVFHKNGSRIPVEYFVDIVTDENNNLKYFYCFASEISERKALQKLLIEREHVFHLIFDSLDQGVSFLKCIRNESGEPVNYQIVHVNDAYESITGFKRDQVVGMLMTELGGSMEPPYWPHYKKAFITREPVSFDTYSSLQRKYFHINAFSPEKDMLITIFHDISNKTERENELSRNKMLLEKTLAFTQCGILIRDDKKKKHELSKTCLAIHGFVEGEDADYQDWLNRIHPADRKRREEVIQNAIAAKTDYHVEYRVIWPNDSIHFVSGQGYGILDEDGNLLKTINIIRDITDTKKV